jgi:large subunit ribosomal protein L25
MATITLAADSRVAGGSRTANRLRAQERIPGVVYGQGISPIAVVVDRRELRHALSGPAGINAVVQLAVGGKTHPTVVKELQRHKVRRSVTHVDFLVVNMDEEITVDVPVVLVGEAKAVLAEGGMVDAAVDTLPIVTTPRHIPNEIAIEISEMQPGDVIRVADITLPAGTSTSADPDTPVVTVLISRAAIEAEAAEGEAAEGEAEGAGESGTGDSAGGDNE